ncbi:DUF58 domain-containing protein [Loktanella sp. S4079]|uniref:DUF58 domain-containing protein n=1 Tax=Loktanella sp. S4079 TaxID=579483 RepID=UPI0005FA7E7A|nr:DUF58 domain-containing protein [Loktanella sp. S4079]KJZ18212.1 hypothetical protein TW80_14825 [Loktanella sp. S4079]
MTKRSGISLDASALIAIRNQIVAQHVISDDVTRLPGGFPIRKHGQGQEHAGSRPYVTGDDMRYIDKGTTARTGALHVRSFHEERDRVSFLVADFRPAMLWGLRHRLRSVAAAEALVWLGWQAVISGGRVGVMAITAEEPFIVRTRGGTRGMLAVIGGLVRAHDAAIRSCQTRGLTDPPLAKLLGGLERIAPKGAAVIIASAFDKPGDPFRDALLALSTRRNLSLLVVEDGNDLGAGHYPMRVPGERRRLVTLAGPATVAPAIPRVPGCRILRINSGLPVQSAIARAEVA